MVIELQMSSHRKQNGMIYTNSWELRQWKYLNERPPLQFINSQKMHSNSQTHQLYLVEFDTLELGYPSTQMIWVLMTLAKGGAAYCR